ncbi:ABC transporter substrate-binding protein [Rouxiella sp. WC2420]|uniref:ABC transporter substrate-binding protein n=1 Tax=Rouxiella sp. WC2420 TaxID=3234145 RepID=A0AB39VT40_9GAMM
MSSNPLALPTLRLNQGDASEARVYYCAHFIAESLGFFTRAGVKIEFTSAQSGGHTIQGGQVPAVIAGEADLTIGGPMVIMKNHEENGPLLKCFCAAVAGNPWYLAAASAQPDFSFASLRGCTVIDVGNVGTATLCFRWLLRQQGIGENELELIPGSGNPQQDFAAVAAGEIDYALHSLHALAPTIASGQLAVVQSLSAATGPVPWSAYIARPEIIAAKHQAFSAFTCAIGWALNWLREQSAEQVSQVIAPFYPDYPAEGLIEAVRGYQASQTFASSTPIAEQDFRHFSDILQQAGWLKQAAPYAALVDSSLIKEQN